MASRASWAASARASALGNRSAGRFASARPTTSTTAGGVPTSGGGSSWTCRMATWSGLSPSKGGRPARQ
ncbi:hypothetical protein B0E53_06393 [Micromonospora sp. MH33]|nr:hypothetical protein B0E53_06393 [Micromonospora sp. MH33]